MVSNAYSGVLYSYTNMSEGLAVKCLEASIIYIYTIGMNLITPETTFY
jgi:hypothetical protein